MTKRLFFPVVWKVFKQVLLWIMWCVCGDIVSGLFPAFFNRIDVWCSCWKKHVFNVVLFKIIHDEVILVPCCFVKQQKHFWETTMEEFHIFENCFFDLFFHWIEDKFSRWLIRIRSNILFFYTSKHQNLYYAWKCDVRTW